ncbi:hypothetical protein EVC37_20460 [Methylocaldum sp. BRCS4]|nr:hypothetical protein [Methylocaldum sp. BRCS4]
MYKARLAFGLPLGAGPQKERRVQFLMWIGTSLLSIPIVFYFSMVLIGGIFGIALVIFGKMTPAEALAYAFAFHGRYPSRWRQEGA